MGHRLHHRMTGTELRLLLGKYQVGRTQRLRYLFAAMTVNHAQARRRQRARGIDYMRQQRFAGQRMQHFGQL